MTTGQSKPLMADELRSLLERTTIPVEIVDRLPVDVRAAYREFQASLRDACALQRIRESDASPFDWETSRDLLSAPKYQGSPG